VARSECIRHDEIQALAKGGRSTVPEQDLGTGTPPRDGPVRIGDDDGVIRHVTYPAPRQNAAAQHPDLQRAAWPGSITAGQES
jgi:hypothetical protein